MLFSTGGSAFWLWEVEVPGTGAEDGEGRWLRKVGRSSLLLGRKMSKKANASMGLEAETTSQRKYNAGG